MHHVLSSQELFEEKIMKKADIIDRLENGYVKFIYHKENGDRRVAFGTLKDEFIDRNFKYSNAPENSKKRKGEKAAEEMGYIKYYDLVKHGWRMFRVSSDVFYKESYDTLEELEEAYPKLRQKLDRYRLPDNELPGDEEETGDGENEDEEAPEE